MGFDIKAAMDAIVAVVSQNYPFLLAGLALLLLFSSNRIRHGIEKAFTDNWQLTLLAMLAFGFRRGGDLSTPYVQSARLIVKNAVLWVMFLASMGASVFFSFDSHFNAIFPTEARKRAAEIRTTNQIGGVIADIGALTQKRQIEEAERLFDTDGRKAYDRQLASLSQAAQG